MAIPRLKWWRKQTPSLMKGPAVVLPMDRSVCCHLLLTICHYLGQLRFFHMAVVTEFAKMGSLGCYSRTFCHWSFRYLGISRFVRSAERSSLSMCKEHLSVPSCLPEGYFALEKPLLPSVTPHRCCSPRGHLISLMIPAECHQHWS
jgi:hypothetical protein